VIRVTVEVQHTGGSVEIVEYDPHCPTGVDAARRAVELAAARALKRTTCAIHPAEEPGGG
jgi:hypothetical protein